MLRAKFLYTQSDNNTNKENKLWSTSNVTIIMLIEKIVLRGLDCSSFL